MLLKAPSKSDERLGGVLSDVQLKLDEFALKSDSNMHSLIEYQQKVRTPRVREYLFAAWWAFQHRVNIP